VISFTALQPTLSPARRFRCHPGSGPVGPVLTCYFNYFDQQKRSLIIKDRFSSFIAQISDIEHILVDMALPTRAALGRGHIRVVGDADKMVFNVSFVLQSGLYFSK
jgi:hypothetical protein